MDNIFLYSHWLALPISTRIKIASIFGIIKTGSTEVFNSTIKSDGYKITDIERALNIDALQKYLGTDETDMNVLWKGMVDKVTTGMPFRLVKPETPASEDVTHVTDAIIPETVVTTTIADVVKPKRIKKPKGNG